MAQVAGNHPDAPFTDIHHLISEEKRKAFEHFREGDEGDSSISVLGQYDGVIGKVSDLHKKVKAMEEKYETNFKSLWNVLSMTESAVFEYIRDTKLREKEKAKD